MLPLLAVNQSQAQPRFIELRPEVLIKAKPAPKFPDFSANYQNMVVAKAEAAERQRQADLEAARAAEEARQQQLAIQTANVTPAAPVTVTAPISGTCESWMAAAGVTDLVNARELVRRESGCDPNNWNGKSYGLPLSVNTACGIGQQLPCGKWPHQWNDPVGGLIDMQNYVFARYGSWANAVAYHNAHNSY